MSIPPPVTVEVTDTGTAPVIAVTTIDAGGATTVHTTVLAPVTVVQVAATGLPGPPGAPGTPGAVGLTFVQDMPLAEWTIPHQFDHWPSVSVTDTTGDVIAVQVAQAPGVVSIHTVLPTAGRAFLI